MNIRYEASLALPGREGALLPPMPFAPLPLGSIRAKGWLQTQLALMGQGVTGRLQEISPFLQPENNGWLNPDTDKGWEEFPYWLRGYYPLAVLLDDGDMLRTARACVDRILETRQPDGWFGIPALKQIEGKDGRIVCDLYGHILLLFVLRQHEETTGDPRVLPLMRDFIRFCLGLPDGQFIPNDRVGNLGWGGGSFGSQRPFVQQFRAGEALMPLYWYYERTGDANALALAARCFHASDFAWDEWLDHHAVNFAQRLGYSTVFSRQSGEEWQRDTALYWLTQHRATWGQAPRGLLHMDERLRPGCVDPRQAFETCGMAELLKCMCDVGATLGQAWPADLAEDIMLNHYPAAYTPDYKALHYLTAANMPLLDDYAHHPTRNGSTRENAKSYIAYTPFNRCCGHNAGFAWPWYAANAWQRTEDGGLLAWLYGPVDVDCGDWALGVETNYPFDGEVRIHIRRAPLGEAPLRLRIPAWCTQAQVAIQGQPVFSTAEKEGFLCVTRSWQAGDALTASFGMKLSMTRWPRTGAATLDLGPLSYSLDLREEWIRQRGIQGYPQSDAWPSWELFPMDAWQYAFCGDALQDAVITKNPVPDQPFTRENAPIRIRIRARKVPEWGLSDHAPAPLQASPVRTGTEAEWVDMIPLGCARLRMSVLPVAGDGPYARPWKPEPTETPLEARPRNRFDVLYGKPKEKIIDP